MGTLVCSYVFKTLMKQENNAVEIFDGPVDPASAAREIN